MRGLSDGLRLLLRRYGPASAALLLLLLLWHWAVVAWEVKEFILPTPLRAIAAFGDPSYHWGQHILVTTYEIVGAFVISAVLGVLLGVMIVWNPWVERTMLPLLVLFNTLPKVALAPLFVIWMGFGVWPNIVIAVTVAFFPVVISTAAGLSLIEPELLDLARVLRGGRLQVFAKIRFPNALPHIFSGLKVSASLAVVGAIVGEFVASDRGLGSLIIAAGVTLSTPAIFAALLLISFLGLALFGLVAIVERLVMPWEFRSQAGR
ncbi:MAG: ABC transporter permease [Alphaproteobacteria bacterium]|nr:ABC transporter permease [Alphaproteobacteria bacterium]